MSSSFVGSDALRRVLLHTELSDGSVIPVWEEATQKDVEVMKDVMACRQDVGDGLRLHYKRIPITAEKPPNFAHLSDLMNAVIRMHSSNTPIVLNCQLGRGRSTTTSVSTIQLMKRQDGGRLTSMFIGYHPPNPRMACEGFQLLAGLSLSRTSVAFVDSEQWHQRRCISTRRCKASLISGHQQCVMCNNPHSYRHSWIVNGRR